MGKPKPKTRIAVEALPNPRALRIHYSEEWVRDKIWEDIGDYGYYAHYKESRMFQIEVSPVYDINEVAEYYRTLLDEKEE